MKMLYPLSLIFFLLGVRLIYKEWRVWIVFKPTEAVITKSSLMRAAGRRTTYFPEIEFSYEIGSVHYLGGKYKLVHTESSRRAT